MFGKIFIAILICLDYSNCLNLCGDWTQYKDIKCIKVLEKKGTEEEALNACTKLDQSSILLTIHSQDEQDYLISFLEKYNISLNVWLGMKYSEKAFKWIDGTNTDYTNWSEDAVKDGSTQCAEMSLQKESIGKWSDVLCKKSALIVCQKKQEININILKNALENMTKVYEKKFENLTKVIEKQENQINNQEKEIQNLKSENLNQKTNFTQELSKQQNQVNNQEKKINSLIPVGFLYTQLPNQSSPQELWPNMKWSEITSQYSGLFFRAKGGESLPFGQTQSANQSHISDVYYSIYSYGSWSGPHYDKQYTSLTRGNWTKVNPAIGAVSSLYFYKTSGEVRPKNTAIKIFKRIQ